MLPANVGDIVLWKGHHWRVQCVEPDMDKRCYLLMRLTKWLKVDFRMNWTYYVAPFDECIIAYVCKER